jgi:ComF family protein
MQEVKSTITDNMKLLRAAADFILPALCGICQARTDQSGALCAQCWGKLSFISAPYCDCCGAPFSLPSEPGLLCAACLTQPPLYRKARAALVYDELGRKLISQFKYGDKLHLLPTFAPWLQRAAADLLPGANIIMPVPLHWTRLWGRRFNQAALLARTVGLPVDTRTLVRKRRTAQQVGMTREQRMRNVAEAFTVRGSVAGKTIILVDDVHTTGATLTACTQALLSAAAKEVRVLTLARVVRPEQIDG